MNAIEFQAVAHDGVVDLPPEHHRLLDGRRVRVVLVDAEPLAADDNDTLFARLRRVKTRGPTDLATNHGAYVVRDPDA
jgi:hypothetical protein